MTRVLVTGVRAKTGRPLAELLVARPDVEVLGGSSDPSTMSTDGVQPTAFSWGDPAGRPGRPRASMPSTSSDRTVPTPRS